MTPRWITPLVVVVLCSGFAGPLSRPAQSMNLPVNVGAANVSGRSQAILVDVNGLALYYLTSDTASTSACTGSCLTDRPAVLSDTVPPTPSSVPQVGFLGIAQSANGSQVTYDGHFLYRFTGDQRMGDANGEGLKGPQTGIWHVATPEL